MNVVQFKIYSKGAFNKPNWGVGGFRVFGREKSDTTPKFSAKNLVTSPKFFVKNLVPLLLY